MRLLTALALAAFATLSGCSQTPEHNQAEAQAYADSLRSHIVVVPFPELHVTCFVMPNGYGDGISCVRDEAAR